MDTEAVDDIVIEEESDTSADAIRKLRERLNTCVKEKQEYLEGWQRARADFTNQKRLEDARREELLGRSRLETVEKLLPLVDAFDQAFLAPGWSDADPKWKTGIERLAQEVLKALADLGVTAFTPIGEVFDPVLHTAIREMDGEEGVVLAVDRQGFRMGEVIVRPAYVAVGKKA